MAPRRPDPDKRSAILAAALELFVERGFHGTSVPDVAKAAGVGAGTIYRYFESKEALVNTLYQTWKQRLGEVLLSDMSLDMSARELLKSFWTRYARFAQTYPRVQAFLELHHHADYLDAESRAIETRLHGVALSVVERLKATHAVKNMDSEVLIALVFGALVGLVKAAWLGQAELTDTVIAQAEQCVWEAIRA